MGKFSRFNSDSIRIVDYGSLQPYGYNVVDWNLVFKIRFPQGSNGSSPFSGTILFFVSHRDFLTRHLKIISRFL